MRERRMMALLPSPLRHETHPCRPTHPSSTCRRLIEMRNPHVDPINVMQVWGGAGGAGS